jgi:hypothetical protein
VAKSSDQQLQKVPSARPIDKLMTTTSDHLSKADSITVAAIEAGVPALVDARTLTDRFYAMMRKRTNPISALGSRRQAKVRSLPSPRESGKISLRSAPT